MFNAEREMKSLFLMLTLAVSVASASGSACAQYPSKPIHLIVPLAAGGPTDNVARTVAQALSRAIGQPVVVENKPGADGAIGTQAAIHAAPDGYTLLFAPSSVVAIPLVHRSTAVDPIHDLEPVSMIGRFPFGLYVHPGVPAKSLAEFIAYARANPDKLDFATSTASEFLAAAQFMKATGVRMTRVPYKGAAQAMPDLIAGRVQVNFGPLSVGLPYVRDGRLRVLATLLPERSPFAPEVPTLAEAGYPEAGVPTWQALFMPAKTPQEVVDRISGEVNEVLRDRVVRAQLDRLSFQIEGSTPRALGATIRADARLWEQFVREYGLASE
jgi:tripartite-type tricarboxylate transporter receptor subunit TctC